MIYNENNRSLFGACVQRLHTRWPITFFYPILDGQSHAFIFGLNTVPAGHVCLYTTPPAHWKNLCTSSGSGYNPSSNPLHDTFEGGVGSGVGLAVSGFSVFGARVVFPGGSVTGFPVGRGPLTRKSAMC